MRALDVRRDQDRRTGGRDRHTSRRRLCLAGGNPSALACANLYDPASRNWSPTGSVTAAHPHGLAELLQDGRVLAAGTWTATGPHVDPLYDSAAAVLPNGQVLDAGGRRDVWRPVRVHARHRRRGAVHTPAPRLMIVGVW